jgi:hypothetical protein
LNCEKLKSVIKSETILNRSHPLVLVKLWAQIFAKIEDSEDHRETFMRSIANIKIYAATEMMRLFQKEGK